MQYPYTYDPGGDLPPPSPYAGVRGRRSLPGVAPNSLRAGLANAVPLATARALRPGVCLTPQRALLDASLSIGPSQPFAITQSPTRLAIGWLRMVFRAKSTRKRGTKAMVANPSVPGTKLARSRAGGRRVGAPDRGTRPAVSSWGPAEGLSPPYRSRRSGPKRRYRPLTPNLTDDLSPTACRMRVRRRICELKS